jgi:DNA-directed RNA polymerases I, II, and III subunit RPABC5
MIIPVKCFTCGKVLGDKYLYYIKHVREEKIKMGIDNNDVIYLDETNAKKTPEGKIMDKLGLNKLCCRRHMLTHVDID